MSNILWALREFSKTGMRRLRKLRRARRRYVGPSAARIYRVLGEAKHR
jgi:hypothetical protein